MMASFGMAWKVTNLKLSYIQISISYMRSLHNTLGCDTKAVTEGKINWSSGMVSFFKRCWIILRIATWLPSSLQNNHAISYHTRFWSIRLWYTVCILCSLSCGLGDTQRCSGELVETIVVKLQCTWFTPLTYHWLAELYLTRKTS